MHASWMILHVCIHVLLIMELYLADMSGVKRHGAESRIKPWTGCIKLARVEGSWAEALCWLGDASSAAASALSTIPKNRNPALLYTQSVVASERLS